MSKQKKVNPEANPKYTLFYTAKSPFSNHHLNNGNFNATQFELVCHITGETFRYNCVEQRMMHAKAILFDDSKIAQEILRSGSPVQQKRLGRQVSHFDEKTWEEEREQIVESALMAKFGQNENLRKALFATADTTLVEAAPRDRIWGIGLGVNDPDARDRTKWRGRNLLGKLLTRVRDKMLASTSKKKSTHNRTIN